MEILHFVQDDSVRFRMTVETSGFCHSERSEESVMNVTMAEGGSG